MAIISIPDKNKKIKEESEIREFLQNVGVWYDRWEANATLNDNASQEDVIAAYSKALEPFMNNNGYKVADVININSTTENYEAIRNKFLQEHTHTEDEVRVFVDGEGLFWFNLEGHAVFNVLCQKGDLISVPAGSRHWFDAGESDPFVKAIRIFIDTSGWVPHYTGSDIEKFYLE